MNDAYVPLVGGTVARGSADQQNVAELFIIEQPPLVHLLQWLTDYKIQLGARSHV